nr:hypothetical protein [Tanacetum cinerariifolium]
MRLVLSRKKMNNYEPDVNVKNNRLLITVNVVGSSGPLRFLVNEDDKVSNVIDLSLKLYARGGRLPILGSDINNFMLYVSDAGSGGALKSSEEIGSCGGRNFALYKKNNQVPEARSRMITRQHHSGRWKAQSDTSGFFSEVDSLDMLEGRLRRLLLEVVSSVLACDDWVCACSCCGYRGGFCYKFWNSMLATVIVVVGVVEIVEVARESEEGT